MVLMAVDGGGVVDVPPAPPPPSVPPAPTPPPHRPSSGGGGTTTSGGGSGGGGGATTTTTEEPPFQPPTIGDQTGAVRELSSAEKAKHPAGVGAMWAALMADWYTLPHLNHQQVQGLNDGTVDLLKTVPRIPVQVPPHPTSL